MHKAVPVMMALLVGLGIPSAARAQAPAEEADTEVVVTATRRAQPKNTASAAVSVITAAEIAASGAATVAEALRATPGLDVLRQGGVGALASPSLRGSTAGQVLVLVDGRRVNNPQSGQANLADIPVANIERIEVVRGGGSALYGSDALGGVINVITRKPSEDSQTRLGQSLGSFGTYALDGVHSGSFGRVQYVLSGQRVSSENDFTFPQGGAEVHQSNAGYTNWDLTGKLVADLGARRSLSLSVEQGSGRTNVAGPLSFPSPQAQQRDRRTLLDLRYQMPMGDASDLSVALYRTQTRTQYTDPGAWVPLDALHRTTLDVAELLGHARAGASHDITYGYEFRDQRVRSNTVGRHSQQVNAAYLQDQWALGSLQVIPGVRADFAEGFAGEVSPKLGLVYRVSDSVTARGNVGRAFHAPAVADLYWPDDGFAAGNPALDAERGAVMDLGATWQAAPSVQIEATAFYHNVSNLIEWAPNPAQGNKYTPMNVGRARIRGVEMGAQWQMSGRLSARANYTYQDARDRGGVAGIDGKSLRLRPISLANLGFAYQMGKANAGVDLQYTGRRPVDAANATYLPGVVLTNLRLQMPLGQAATAALRVDNLLDQHYQLQPDYPLPGRIISLSLSQNW